MPQVSFVKLRVLCALTNLHDRRRRRWFIGASSIRQRDLHHDENQNRHADQTGKRDVSDIDMPKLMIAPHHALDHQSTQRFSGD